jgi:ELWxxDGT repeat protein
LSGDEVYFNGDEFIGAFRGKTLIAMRSAVTFTEFVVYLHDPGDNTVERLPVQITADTRVGPRVAVLGDKFVYVHETERLGAELWISNGTRQGTRLLKDILRGSLGAFDPRWSTNWDGPHTFNGKAYFVANDNAHGPELWVTDGTAAGTRLLRDMVPGAAGPTDLLFVNPTFVRFYNRVLSIGSKIILQAAGSLWTTDGTPAGTKRLQLRDESGASIAPTYGVQTMMGTEDQFFFEGYRGTRVDNPKTALYRGNLNSGVATLVRDINTTPDCIDSGDGGVQFDWISDFAFRGGLAYFSAADKITVRVRCPDRYANSELWVSDGTREGTKKVKEIYPGIGGSIGQQYRYFGSDPTLLTLGGAGAIEARLD